MQDLTSGSLTGHLLKTTSFMLVSMIFQTLYVLVDLFWMGRLGTDAIGAVGLAGNLSFVVIAITQVLSVGATTLVSHASGRKDQERAIFLFNQSQVLVDGVGLLFLAVAMLFRHQYAAGQSATEGMRIATEQFLLWFIPAMALQFAMVAMGAALRGTGNFKPGMLGAERHRRDQHGPRAVPDFRLGPVSGNGRQRRGASSTFIAIVVGVAWISFYFIDSKAYLRFHFAHWKPQLSVWWEMLKIGLPAGAEFALMGIYMAVVYAITKPFGAAAQGGFTIGLRIVQSAFLPVVALGFAVAPVAGTELRRAQRRPRARSVQGRGGHGGGRHAGHPAIAIYLAAAPLMRIFTTDAEVDRGRRRIPPHRGGQLRAVGPHLCVVEHVPGARQYHSVAGDLGAAPGDRRRSRRSSSRASPVST